jgi:hypothetical protein
VLVFVCLQFRSAAAALCIDTKYRGGNENFKLADCIKDGKGGGEQVYKYTDHLQVYVMLSVALTGPCDLLTTFRPL